MKDCRHLQRWRMYQFDAKRNDVRVAILCFMMSELNSVPASGENEVWSARFVPRHTPSRDGRVGGVSYKLPLLVDLFDGATSR